MNMRYVLLLLLTLLSLSACGPTQRLADLKNPWVYIFSYTATPNSVWNYERKTNLFLGSDSRCVQLSPSVSVTIDGVEFEGRDLGYDPRNIPRENQCSHPQFTKTDFSQLPRAKPSTTFKISDSSATFIMEVPNYLAERPLSLVTEQPLRAGQRATLRWNSNVDTSLVRNILIFAQPANEPMFVPTVISGNSASFTVPRSPIGPVVLDLDQVPSLTPSSCSGLTRCEVQAFLPDWLPATFSL